MKIRRGPAAVTGDEIRSRAPLPDAFRREGQRMEDDPEAGRPAMRHTGCTHGNLALHLPFCLDEYGVPACAHALAGTFALQAGAMPCADDSSPRGPLSTHQTTRSPAMKTAASFICALFLVLSSLSPSER